MRVVPRDAQGIVAEPQKLYDRRIHCMKPGPIFRVARTEANRKRRQIAVLQILAPGGRFSHLELRKSSGPSMTLRFKLTMASIAVILIANSLLSVAGVEYLQRVWMDEVKARVWIDLNAARTAYDGHIARVASFLRAAAADKCLQSALANATKGARAGAGGARGRGKDGYPGGSGRSGSGVVSGRIPPKAATAWPGIRSSPGCFTTGRRLRARSCFPGGSFRR